MEEMCVIKTIEKWNSERLGTGGSASHSLRVKATSQVQGAKLLGKERLIARWPAAKAMGKPPISMTSGSRS